MTTHIRVLLVGRNMEVAREVQRQLEDLGHIVPAVAVDGNDALAAAMMPGADAVLIDARLDGAIDSIDLAAHMHNEADLPVLFFSDRIDIDVLERAGNAGVYGVLTLPLHDTMLRANLALSVHRHQLDSELRKRERRYRLLAEYSTDLISAHTPDGRIIYASRVCAELLGYQPEELAGRDVYDALHPDDVPSVRRAHRAALHGEPSRVAYRLRTRQGHYVWVETTCRALHDSHTGEAIEIVAVTRDISERKQMERERERIQKLESVGTLAGGIAHDFNNLLTGILGNISLAQVYCQPDDEMGELLTEAEDASLQAKALTQQLLIFAKGGDPIKKRMPLTSLLVDSTRLALKGSNVRVEFDIAKDLWSVEVDAGQFGQVLCNIVNNADHAMPGGGTLQVSATNCSPSDPSLPFSSGPLVRISVHDSGIGIPEEHLPRVFDPYFTTKQRGSGLGLAVAHSVVAAHGGYIGVESCLGAGTTFHIYLPALVAIETRPSIDQKAKVGRGRVLVMDDEQLVRDVACRILTHLGYQCVAVQDGQEAVDAYRMALDAGERFDVVIMDLIVPGGMGGKEALAQLIEIDPGVHALVSSGYSTDPVLTNHSAHGFLGVVSKPYQMGDLQQAVEAAMI